MVFLNVGERKPCDIIFFRQLIVQWRSSFDFHFSSRFRFVCVEIKIVTASRFETESHESTRIETKITAIWMISITFKTKTIKIEARKTCLDYFCSFFFRKLQQQYWNSLCPFRVIFSLFLCFFLFSLHKQLKVHVVQCFK